MTEQNEVSVKMPEQNGVVKYDELFEGYEKDVALAASSCSPFIRLLTPPLAKFKARIRNEEGPEEETGAGLFHSIHPHRRSKPWLQGDLQDRRQHHGGPEQFPESRCRAGRDALDHPQDQT